MYPKHFGRNKKKRVFTLKNSLLFKTKLGKRVREGKTGCWVHGVGKNSLHQLVRAGDLQEPGETFSGFLEETGWVQETPHQGSPTECVGPQGSVLICPEGTGPSIENHWLRMSHPWVHSAAPWDQCPTRAFGIDQRCDGKKRWLAFWYLQLIGH